MLKNTCIKAKSLFDLILKKTENPKSSQGISRERYRRAALTSFTLIISRIVNIAVGLVTIPLLLKYLGNDLFGIWMVINSFVIFTNFTDLGIGIGLRLSLVECVGHNDTTTPQRLVSTALFSLTAVFVFLSLFTFVVFPLISWETIIRCEDVSVIPQILPTMIATMIAIAIGLPLTQNVNIEYALQCAYRGYAFSILGRILAFFYLIFCVKHEFSLWAISFGYIIIPYLFAIPSWILLMKKTPWLFYYRPFFSWQELKKIMAIGVHSIIQNLCYSLRTALPVFMIGGMVSAAAIVPFSITQRIFGVCNIVAMSMMMGLMGAMGEAWHKKDFSWVKRALKRSLFTSVFFCVIPMIVVAVFCPWIIFHWTNNEQAVPSVPLLVACVFYFSLEAIRVIMQHFLVAINCMRFTTINTFYSTLLFVVAGYGLGYYYRSPEMIIWGLVVFGIALPSIGLAIKIISLFNQSEKRLLVNEK